MQECKSCSKEITGKVPIARVIEKLDSFFSKNDLDGAEHLLAYWENEARRLSDNRGLLEVLNEQIGLYRRLNKSEEGLKAVEEAFCIIDSENLGSLVSASTVYLNGATTLRAFGKPQEAMTYYAKAQAVFENADNVTDFKKASLYNNMASSLSEVGDFEKAEEYYFKAIEILSGAGGNEGEIAVSYVNLAHLYFDEDAFSEKVGECMDKAWEYLNSPAIVKDGSYAFICIKCAPSFEYFGLFLQSEKLKEEAEKIYGRA